MRIYSLRGCVSLGLIAAAWAFAGACSAGGDGAGSRAAGGGSGIGSGGTISTTGGSAGIINTGGSGAITVTGGSSGVGGLPDGSDCAGFSEQAENQVQPADIVVVVDNSGSMTFEAGAVQQNLNGFVQAIVGANIDAHVVLISSYPGTGNGMCIPAPLGSGQCPGDTNLPIFKHVDQEVDSHNALELLVSLFSQYQDMYRVGASKHFVVVTDDNSNMTSADFNAQITPLLQGVDSQFQKYTFHSIYAFTGPAAIGTPCFDITFQKAAAEGIVYRELVQMTGGAQGDLCLQDFGPVFAALGQNVIAGSGLSCEWTIPPPPNGDTLDKNKVNVDYTPTGGAAQTIGFVSDSGQCGSVQNGWYYDNYDSPTKVLVCPQTCSVIQQGGGGARIDIKFGCEQVIAVPK
jgi:hypothetical protein